jgi:hypothetical protein
MTGRDSRETNALSRMAQDLAFDALHVVGIAVKTGRYQLLADKLWAFLQSVLITFRLAKRPFGISWRAEADILFENPEGSGWAPLSLLSTP